MGQREKFVSSFTPLGTARERFLRGIGTESKEGTGVGPQAADDDDFEAGYLGWEIARCTQGLSPDEQRAIAALAAACIAALHAGATRIPLDDARLAAALKGVGAHDSVALARSLALRAQRGEGPAQSVIGAAGDRKPLVVDGEWLSTARMWRLEQSLCDRIRMRVSATRSAPDRDARGLGRAVAAVAAGPPPLTDEQKRVLRVALNSRLALVSGGPGTGKTTIVVALVRALAWMGVPMEAIAIAAPTGKAAHRLEEALAKGFPSQPRDIAEAGLRAIAPVPQTLHRLLAWSPARGRFGRHENDPLPHRIVVVDEASMIDLAMMDRLVRALPSEARLVLLGDADQLPSVEAGAVFRDLCAALGGAKLTTNLRVAREPSARRIVAAAFAVTSGSLDSGVKSGIKTRRSVDELLFEGVEHVAARWSEVGEAFLARWWDQRISIDENFVRQASRTFKLQGGKFEHADRVELRALLFHHATARLLCATRVQGFPASSEAINERLLLRMRGGSSLPRGSKRALEIVPGAPVLVQRNDYARQLYNGDQGLVVRVDRGDATGPQPMALFARGESFDVFPLDAAGELALAFAMTVHKAQGSEFDHVALVLPDDDVPLLTRELVYTAITRARLSVSIVGSADLLTRAVARSVERHSGVAERLLHA
jgi:exodeoxyribonuclease V alpha subunit